MAQTELAYTFSCHHAQRVILIAMGATRSLSDVMFSSSCRWSHAGSASPPPVLGAPRIAKLTISCCSVACARGTNDGFGRGLGLSNV